MVKRYTLYDDGFDNSSIVRAEDGDLVEYEDHEKVADLCERMATLLKCTPAPIINGNSRYANEIRAAIAEWEAMK